MFKLFLVLIILILLLIVNNYYFVKETFTNKPTYLGKYINEDNSNEPTDCPIGTYQQQQFIKAYKLKNDDDSAKFSFIDEDDATATDLFYKDYTIYANLNSNKINKNTVVEFDAIIKDNDNDTKNGKLKTKDNNQPLVEDVSAHIKNCTACAAGTYSDEDGSSSCKKIYCDKKNAKIKTLDTRLTNPECDSIKNVIAKCPANASKTCMVSNN